MSSGCALMQSFCMRAKVFICNTRCAAEGRKEGCSGKGRVGQFLASCTAAACSAISAQPARHILQKDVQVGQLKAAKVKAKAKARLTARAAQQAKGLSS